MRIILRKQTLVLFLILLLAVFLRFSSLAKIPSGLLPEEASNGWNAYSILKTGRDEWGKFFPVVFRETGGFKLALNSYLTVPAVFFFGLTEFAVRFSSFLAGVLSVFLTYFLVKTLFKKENYALTAAFFLSISPWHISVGRYGMDVNLALPLFLTGLIFFLKAQVKPKLLILSAIFFGLTFYSYFSYLIFTPLFIIGAVFLTRKTFWATGRKKYLFLFFLLLFIFFLPYLSSAAIFTRFSQVTSGEKIGFTNRINEHRQACSKAYPSPACLLIYNKFTDRVVELTRNYINHYSVTTFFLYGSEYNKAGMPQRWGFLYPFEFVLIIAGLVFLIRKNLFPPVLLFWLFLYALPSAASGEGHIWRMFTILPLPQIFGGIGFCELTPRRKNIWLTLTFIAVIFFFLSRFWLDYTGFFPYFQGRNSYTGFRDVYQYALGKEKDYDQIIIAPINLGFDQLYIYYLFYSRYNPRFYQQEIEVDRQAGKEGWVRVARITKWYFFKELKEIDNLPKGKKLLVVDGDVTDQTLGLLNIAGIAKQKIYYQNGDVAFRIIEVKN